MLKAFSFSECNPNDIPSDNDVWRAEKKIMIRQAAEMAAAIYKAEKCECPICRNEGVPAFCKYNVDYYRCRSCHSIFQAVTLDEITRYNEMPELKAFRKGEEFQSTAVRQRTGQWRELLEWLKFRSFRYLGKNTGLRIVDYDNTFDGFRDLIQNSEFCDTYISASLRSEALPEEKEGADLALYMACIQQTVDPLADLKRAAGSLMEGGLIFLSSRLGTGFDVLTLGEHAERIFPYSHTLLPSLEGIEQCLAEAGFHILETITPGNYDVSRVYENREYIREDDYFLQYMFGDDSEVNLDEFQRFLQKNRLSSYAQVIAQKRQEGMA